MASVVVCDACVLYSAPLRDFLIRAANAGLIRARWSDRILDECFRNVLANRPDLKKESLVRTRELMTVAVADCMVFGFESLCAGLVLPDSDDIHVLAAAVKSGAESIVTFNLRDFSGEILARYDLEATHPDELVLRMLDADPQAVVSVVAAQAEALRAPKRSILEVVDTLRNCGLTRSATRLEASLRGGVNSRDEFVDSGRPFIFMDDLERQRAWDQTSLPLVRGMLSEAQNGKNEFVVAVAILTLPNGVGRVVHAQDDAGDGEGLRPIFHMVARGAVFLHVDERLTLELVTVRAEASKWHADARTAPAVPNRDLDAIFDRDWIEACIGSAREHAQTVAVSVGGLTVSDGAFRVVVSEIEFGDGEGRASVAGFVREVRRSGLLGQDESVDRFLVESTRTEDGWNVEAVADSVRPNPARRG